MELEDAVEIVNELVFKFRQNAYYCEIYKDSDRMKKLKMDEYNRLADALETVLKEVEKNGDD